MTDEQFHYKTRKKAYGPFKQQLFDLPAENLHAYVNALEEKFHLLFDKLGMRGTRPIVDEHVHPTLVHRPVPDALKQALEAGAAAR
jgi:hypothetical protein